jgi:hypothetical protein
MARDTKFTISLMSRPWGDNAPCRSAISSASKDGAKWFTAVCIAASQPVNTTKKISNRQTTRKPFAP